MLPHDDHYFAMHKSAGPTHRPTKIEQFVLVQPQARPIIEANAKRYPLLSWQDVEVLPHCQYTLHLKAQAAKQSDDVATEIFSRLMRYSNGIYFLRGYKLVGKDFHKFEATRVPLKQKPYLDPEDTVNGLLKFLRGMTKGADNLLVPHWRHDGDYDTIPNFLKKI